MRSGIFLRSFRDAGSPERRTNMQKDYKKLTKEELLALCEKRGIECDGRTGVNGIISLLIRQSLENKTKAELIAECDALGFEVVKNAKKEDIFKALVAVMADQDSIMFEAEDEDEILEESVEEAAAEELLEDATEEELIKEDIPLEELVKVVEPETELPPEMPGYEDGLVEEPAAAEAPAASSSGRRRNRMDEESRQARAKRRENIAKIEGMTNLSADDIDRLAYGDEASLSPRTLRNAPRDMSIEGGRISQVRRGEQDDFELIESMNNSAYIVHGEVCSILPARTIRTENPETGEPMLCVNATAVIEYGDRMVYIPSKYFFEDYYNMPQDRVREYMQGRLGSEVDFKIVNIERSDPNNPVYTGSRIAAMKKKRCDFWYSERAKGRSLIQPDSVQQARVVAVSERLVFVEIFGAEIKVEPKEIAYEYVVDAREYYVPGDIVFVKIKSVTLQDKDRAAALGYPVDCVVSIKDVYEDPKKEYFSKQMWHSAFKGVVVNIDIGKDNAVNIFVNDGRIDILCHLGDGITKMPERGDSVIGKITGMNEQTGFVWGVINHINPSRQERRSRPESFVRRR